MSAANEGFLRALASGLDRLQAATTETINRPLRELVAGTLGVETEEKIYDDAVRMSQSAPVQVLDSTTLSEGQIKNYLEHCGIHCPHCLSHDIEGGFVETGNGGASQKIRCSACGTEWTDNYKLGTISHVTLGTQSTAGGKTIE